MAGGPYDDLLRDLERLQAARVRDLPSPAQLRKCRARLDALAGKVPFARLAPLYQRLHHIEEEIL